MEQNIGKDETVPIDVSLSISQEDQSYEKKSDYGPERSNSFHSDQQTVDMTTEFGEDDTDQNLDVDDEEKEENIEDSAEFEEELQKFADRLNKTFSDCKYDCFGNRLIPNVGTEWVEKCKQQSIKK